MISHRHKCIFVHIPKTGGSSVERVIWPGPRTEADLWGGTSAGGQMRNRYQSGGLQHLLAHQIRHAIGPAIFNAYFKFTIVRNPWDKVISQYHYMRGRPDLKTFIGLRDDAPLEAYLQRIAETPHVQWLPQTAFLQDESGRDLPDFIARFETLNADMQTIFARLGLPCRQLPHANASARAPDHRPYFNAATRLQVARFYATDIERFKYRF
jgi:hypothetical protein